METLSEANMNKIFSKLQFISLLLASVFLVSCIIEDDNELYDSIHGGGII